MKKSKAQKWVDELAVAIQNDQAYPEKIGTWVNEWFAASIDKDQKYLPAVNIHINDNYGYDYILDKTAALKLAHWVLDIFEEKEDE